MMTSRTVEDIAREVDDLQRDFESKMMRLHRDKVDRLALLQRDWQILTGEDGLAWLEFLSDSTKYFNRVMWAIT